MTTQTADQEQQGFTAETFAQFWAKPDLSADAATSPIADDVIGYWPGTDEPVRGRDEYVGALHELLARVPDLTLQVMESADSGEYLFIRWVAHATGANGRIEHPGVDRIRIVDGKVVENRIFFDRADFERKLGISLDLAEAA
jgi:SnoaL-like polyketide cyclase